jgi:hypothetical protein
MLKSKKGNASGRASKKIFGSEKGIVSEVHVMEAAYH